MLYCCFHANGKLLCYSLDIFVFKGRMGNLKQALQLIVEKLQDVSQAIEFCKEHDDSDLWEDLINYSLDKPCKTLAV